jgi:hypothetical protein
MTQNSAAHQESDPIADRFPDHRDLLPIPTRVYQLVHQPDRTMTNTLEVARIDVLIMAGVRVGYPIGG